jgi:bifunctional DNA-binding transcriptional regulator/antitoxin component of YhaV-PrlF toxin-antitoxin module
MIITIDTKKKELIIKKASTEELIEFVNSNPQYKEYEIVNEIVLVPQKIIKQVPTPINPLDDKPFYYWKDFFTVT